MQKKISILVLLFVGLLTSCVGDIGPQGPPGYDGFDGEDGVDGEIGTIFEATVDFTDANGYASTVAFPSSLDLFDTDIVLAYVLTEVSDGVAIWEPLPQTIFFDEGILLYGYDHTYFDINFFLDGTVNLGSLGPDFTDSVVFRIAILPANFAATINTDNINEVMSAMNVENVGSVERIY